MHEVRTSAPASAVRPRSAGRADEPPPFRSMLPLLLAALAARVFLLVVGPFFVRPDEVFQALEPAHRLLTGYGVVTWEWHERIRSWLLPGAIAPILWASDEAGFGHSILAVQCVFAILSLAVVAAAVRFGHVFGGRDGALFAGLLAAFFPDTALLGPHTLSEVQGGSLLAIGTMLLSAALRRGRLPSPRHALALGALLGFAAIIRFQLLPGVAAALLALALPGRRRTGAAALLGVALPVLGQTVLDALTLGTPLQSMWKNVAVNVGEHRAALFGTMSPVFYFTSMAEYWGAALVPLAVAFAVGVRRAKLAGLVALAVIVPHSLVAHKEWTFIDGSVPLILAVAGVGAAIVVERLAAAADPLPFGVPLRTAVALAIVGMSIATIFSGYKPMRRDHANFPLLMRDARRVPGLCGLALYVGDEPWWDWTGGYSLLDRDVPIYLLRSPADLAQATPGFDAMLADEATLPTLPTEWRLGRCVRDACLLRRPGSCRAVGSHLIENAPALGLPLRPGSVRP